VINNPNSQRVTGSLSFFSTQGAPMQVGIRLPDGSGSSTTDTDNLFDISIPANGTWRAYTTDAGALKTGWVILEMDNFVDSVAIFSLNSRNSGLISEAAVFASDTTTVQRIFADTGRRSAYITTLTDPTTSDTGIAIANSSPQPANLTIRLLDSAGRATQSTRVTLAPLTSTAKFLKELFPGLSSFQGAVEVQSNVPVASLGLRFTGLVFTTLPVAIVQ
jgi:hypothetical protein